MSQVLSKKFVLEFGRMLPKELGLVKVSSFSANWAIVSGKQTIAILSDDTASVYLSSGGDAEKWNGAIRQAARRFNKNHAANLLTVE